MEERSFSFAFDADYYTKTHADLRDLTPAEAADHFINFGIAEGRQAHPRGARAAFAKHIATFGSVLEIGPFCNPTARGGQCPLPRHA
jgi:hypothetical protein